MKTRAEIERYAEVIESAIRSRKDFMESQIVSGHDVSDYGRQDWELAFAVLQWVLEEDTMDTEMVTQWLVVETRQEVGLLPEDE